MAASEAGILELFKPGVLGRTLMAMLITVVALVGTYGFNAWLPTFFVKQGYTIVQSLWFTMLMSVGAIVGPLIGFWISDKFERRYSIAAVAACAAVAGTIYPNLTSIVAITICGFSSSPAFCFWSLLGLEPIFPELFPTRYRLRGSGMAQLAGRIATIITPYGVVAMFNQYGVSGVVYSIAGLFVLLIVMLLFGIETNRRPLEAIA